jgi:quercetin dioxygenase-like cupin family protein
MATAQLSNPALAHSDSRYDAPHCIVRGLARGALFEPDGFSLWCVLGDFDAGAEIEWDTEHGDEAMFVLAGALECDGRLISEGSTLIIEAGTPTLVRSVSATRVVQFGPTSTTPPHRGLRAGAAADGRGVHVMHPQDAPSISTDDALSVTYFCDGTCPTCRIGFFLVDGSVLANGYSASSHLHSEDEIIHVLDGELRVGALKVPAGTSIAIPEGLRYSFRTSGPFRFLNYRADVSTILLKPGSEPFLETVANLTSMGVARLG